MEWANVIWFIVGLLIGMCFIVFGVFPTAIITFLRDNHGKKLKQQDGDDLFIMEIKKVRNEKKRDD